MNNNLVRHYDVLVVGLGPSGAVAAAMLGRRGISTLVIDRLQGIYDKPRAISIDHEILRHFDNMGIADAVLPYIEPFTTSEHFGAQGQIIRSIGMVPPPYPLGYTPSMVFTQPSIEAVLRDHAASFKCVTIEIGATLTQLIDTGKNVHATYSNKSGDLHNIVAKYVIGCDGAASMVRQSAGMVLEDLVFDEPWLVIDVLAGDAGLAKLPKKSAQFCNPFRPTTYIIGPKNHRRWEIMLRSGEDPRKMENPENVWCLLAPWLQPHEGELWRASAYRFHALVADNWRRGQILIAGDAAHQQPPFIGQGMCQGLRDVSNLVWKLDRVLKGESSSALLNTYTVERKRHVKTLTNKIKAIGESICEQDPDKAAERDKCILAESDGKPATITRQEIIPPLEEGLLAAHGTPGRGMLFPQPNVLWGGEYQLLDKVTGAGWRLILDGRKFNYENIKTLRESFKNFVIYAITPSIDGVTHSENLPEKDGVLAAWFNQHHVAAAIVRPDHYVFGTASNIASLNVHLLDLQNQLA